MLFHRCLNILTRNVTDELLVAYIFSASEFLGEVGGEEEKEYFFSNIRISTVNLFTEMCVQLDKTKLQMLNQYLKGGDLHKNLLESPF